jgi:phosphoribosylformimino-5-aminoimidazole carboxamide ribotide isomerase
MQFRPCIDLHNGVVKQIVGSSYRDSGEAQTNFVARHTADWYARLYRADNLCGGHIIMIGSGNRDAAAQALKAWPGGMQVGGGITARNAREYLELGASHVILTSHVFNAGTIQWDVLKQLKKLIGARRVVLDVSCVQEKQWYYLVTDRWQTVTSIKVTPQLLQSLSEYCDEFLVHAAHVEGKQRGPDPDLVSLLGGYDERPVTYAGGIARYEDIDTIYRLGGGRIHITIGSALDIFGGGLQYPEIVRRCRTLGSSPQ